MDEETRTAAPSIGPHLESRLERLRLRIEAPDADTFSVRRVPASPRSFNKPRTNLLVKRSTESGRCVICVDEDLEYRGSDQSLARSFASGPTQQGWRILAFGGSLKGDLSEVLDLAFNILGTEETRVEAPTETRPKPDSLLGAWAVDLTASVASMPACVTLFRDEEVERAAASILDWRGTLPLIVGESGIGKSNLLLGAAKLLAPLGKKVLRVNMGAVMAGTLFESERETVLDKLLGEARASGAVLAIEQAEWAAVGIPRSAVMLREALDRGVRLIATVIPDCADRFALDPLASRVETIRLSGLCASDTSRVLELLRPVLSEHHGVAIDSGVEQAAVERSRELGGALPGKAIRLLDSAAARARLTGRPAVELLDIYIVASRMLGQAV
jgi:ATP-dependent Clp protease ATP-binding subunit ClpA